MPLEQKASVQCRPTLSQQESWQCPICEKSRHILTACLPGGDEPSWQQHLQAVRELGQPDLFASFLRLILATPALLHEIAARSYVHENKFDKIVLISSSDPDYKLRLHIWWPSSESPFTESIHNHQWVLSSVILAGALHSQEFARADNGRELLHYTYNTRPGMRNLPESAVPERLICVSDSTIGLGSYYVLSTKILHRVISDPQNMTATLMLQGPAEPNTLVHIYTAKPVADNREALASGAFTDDILEEKLRKLIPHLSNG